jgi:hypothetical protein
MAQQAERASAGDIVLRVLAYLARGYLVFLLVGSILMIGGDPESDFIPWANIAALGAVLVAWVVFGTRRRQTLNGVAAMAAAVAAGAAETLRGGDGAERGIIVLFVWTVVVGIPVVLAIHGLPGVRPWVLAKGRLEPQALGGAPATLPSPPPAAPQSGLDADEARIQQRLREIEAQQARIDGVQALLEREAGSTVLDDVRQKLAYAEEVLMKQRARHEARLWSIYLVRWQHDLARFVEHTAGSTLADAERRLQELAAVATRGKEMLAGWERDRHVAITSEGDRCITHLRGLLERCEAVRHGIVVQQAMLAIRGIAPTEDEMRSTALSTEPLESLQTDLGPDGSLAASLATFEAEHERLRDDQAAAEDVERFLTQLERGQA